MKNVYVPAHHKVELLHLGREPQGDLQSTQPMFSFNCLRPGSQRGQKGDQDFDSWFGVPQTKCFPPHTLNFLRVRSIYRKVNPSPTSSKVRLGISPAVMLGVRSVMYPISPIWWPSISTTYSAVSNCEFHGITFEPENSILSSAASSSTRLVASRS